MNPRDLARLGFVLMGVLALLLCLPLVQQLMVFPFLKSQQFTHPLLVFLAVLVTVVVEIGAAAGLIAGRERLVAWLYPAPEERNEAAVSNLEELAFAILGLGIGLSSIPSLASLVGTLVFLNEKQTAEAAGAFRSELVYAVGVVIKIVGGFGLFFMAPTVARWWRSRRRGDRVEPEPAASLSCPTCGHPFRPTDYRPGAQGDRRCSRCRAPLPDELFE